METPDIGRLGNLAQIMRRFRVTQNRRRLRCFKYRYLWIFIIAGRFIGITLLYVLCVIFLVRTNRSLKNGVIFPKSNIALIRWAALVTVLVTFVRSNYQDVLQGGTNSVLDSNTIFVPLVVLLFAGLYKMAYLTAKDSSLAI